jgi:hypothetical protein
MERDSMESHRMKSAARERGEYMKCQTRFEIHGGVGQ